MFDIMTLSCKTKQKTKIKTKTHALLCLYYVVVYEFKYESKMIKPSRLVLAGHDRKSPLKIV